MLSEILVSILQLVLFLPVQEVFSYVKVIFSVGNFIFLRSVLWCSRLKAPSSDL